MASPPYVRNSDPRNLAMGTELNGGNLRNYGCFSLVAEMNRDYTTQLLNVNGSTLEEGSNCSYLLQM